ncbi:hypothetical protein VNO77_39283 [Canavalia gladiata]|uniref:Uncharacterized protein n=1 Tax=Canavalia gladiata TaxID=3824 RepID=A0AAN9PY42_CANGL
MVQSSSLFIRIGHDPSCVTLAAHGKMPSDPVHKSDSGSSPASDILLSQLLIQPLHFYLFPSSPCTSHYCK